MQQQQQQGRGGNTGARGGVGSQAQRYPNPIQRPPSNYQPQSGVQGGLLGNNPGSNVRPRMPANQQQQRGGNKYFPGQGETIYKIVSLTVLQFLGNLRSYFDGLPDLPS
jgi:hypothetical protein